MQKILISVLLVASVTAGAIPVEHHTLQNEDCSQSNQNFTCFMTKMIVILSKAVKSNNINITNSIAFVRDEPVESSERSMQLSEKEILNGLPHDIVKKTVSLVGMFLQSGITFMKSHSLKLNLGAAAEEARTKIKKSYMPMVLLLATKVLALSPIIGGLTLAGIKTFVLGKAALLIALTFMFIKTFYNTESFNNFANNIPQQFNDWQNNDEQWSARPFDYRYKRIMKDNVDANIDAHNLAYTKYVPVVYSN